MIRSPVALVRPAGVSLPTPLPLVVAFVGLTVVPLFVGAASLVNYSFPAMSLVTATYLFSRKPKLYVMFTWWIWLLTPLVRRMVDHEAGWSSLSPVMLTPYLVAGLTLISLLERAPQMAGIRLAGFGFALVGIVWAYVIGAGTAGTTAATYGLLTWLVPVAFGFHLATSWQRYDGLARATETVFRQGLIVLGAYGLIQFALMPAWDAFWMRHSGMSSIGQPAPFQVRIFGPLNSPVVYAAYLMAGLVVTFATRRLTSQVLSLPAWLAFLLSQVRSAWLGCIIGLFMVLARMSRRQALKLIAAAAFLVLAILPFLRITEVQEVALPRLMSLFAIEQDTSFRARTTLYRESLEAALGSTVGDGIGSTNLATKLTNNGQLGEFGVIDSGILEIMFVFGWPGTLLYGGGITLLLVTVFTKAARPGDRFEAAARAVTVGILAQIVFLNPLGGAVGMLFWSFLGLVIAGQRAHHEALATKP